MTGDNPHSDQAEVFRRAMEEALAQLDHVRDELAGAQAKAIDDQIAARDELARIKRESEALAARHFDEQTQKLIADLRLHLHVDMLKKLITWGIPSLWVKSTLSVDPETLTEVWMDLGFDKLGDHIANVDYTQDGRGGYVIFHREDLVLRWWWEFGGTDEVVAFISVPSPEKWESETRIPLAERQEVLEFVGTRVVRDRAPGCKYEIHDNEIRILR